MTSSLVAPHTSARRAALLEQLVVALTTTADELLPIRTRAPDDPTIALLDAWASVGDVLGFYLDRIADEGYLSTAIEPGSILALAGLVGYRPLPGMAAQTYMGYTLNPDPADNAVQFDGGVLFQTVPAAGQQPQTFESADSLVARPSWNLLTPKSSQPLAADATQLVVAGTNANLAPNDMILLGLSDQDDPAAVSVASAQVDYTNGVTTVNLQQPAQAPPTGSQTETAPTPPQTVETALDRLVSDNGLTSQPKPLPGSANELPQTAKSVFTPGSDSFLRLLSTLQPSVAPTLYSALDTTKVGSPSVTGASVMRVTAAPFGAQAPPKPVFNAKGQPAGTQDWPIGDAFTLQLTVTEGDFLRLLAMALKAIPPRHAPSWLARLVRAEVAEEPTTSPVVDAECNVGTISSQGSMEVVSGKQPWSVTLASFGTLILQVPAGKNQVTVSFNGANPAPSVEVIVSVDVDTDAVTLEFVAPSPSVGRQTWDPNVRTPFVGQVGNMQLAVAWTTPPSGEATLTASIQVPLPLADLTVLPLDGIYDGILPGSMIAIDNAADPAKSVVSYHTVDAVDTVSASGYGITGKVTRLTLHDAWITDSDLLQSSLRTLTVHAQPDELTLQPAPLTTDVSGATIELDGLVAGMEPGRLIALSGTRTDLPGDATVQAGEIAMVASVSVGADDGDTAHSTLNLAAPLAYSYQRDSLQVYGNVVSAHQGATINEVLGSGQPAQAPQSFTLSSGPVLADPSPTGSGSVSTLTVTVNGVGYAEVERVDETTPAQSFLTGADGSGKTTIVFPNPLPAGTGNVGASYRAGDGSQGNAQAGQITQLLSRPANLSAVTNPLPATGGSGGDDQESVRSSAPTGLGALGRIVTVNDYALFASSFAGVGKASAILAGQEVLVTVAASDPVQLDADSDLCSGVASAIAEVADPTIPTQVLPAALYMIALTASVVRDPLVSWDETVAAVQSSLLASFGYAQRELGEDVAVSDLIAAAHSAAAVRSFTVTGLALVPTTATASQLSKLATLLQAPVPAVTTLASAAANWVAGALLGTASPAAIAYMSDSAPETMILSEQTP